MGYNSAVPASAGWEERWTGDYVFENEWQSFRTKRDRSLELKSVFHACEPGWRKIAVKVVDIFGNDTMTIVDVSVGRKKELASLAGFQTSRIREVWRVRS